MLVDTSVWVDHFRSTNQQLVELLERGEVECHPFIIGELACGNLKKRTEILSLLAELPQLPSVDHHEALAFVEQQRLAGSAIGWVDVHLLASTLLAGTAIWTTDRKLAVNAERLGIVR